MGEVSRDRGLYSIGAVARMVGVPVASIRNWQDRYGLVEPDRSGGGHRLYSRNDVEQLSFVAELVREGVAPGEAHRLLADRVAEGPPLTVTDPTETPRLLVLLAERDPTSAAVCDYLLRTDGYGVELALSAQEARTKAAGLEPDLVVVELLISGGSGISLIADLATAGATVLAVSSLAARERALAAGADAFLEKPLDPLAFLSAVKDLLGRSALVRVRSQQLA